MKLGNDTFKWSAQTRMPMAKQVDAQGQAFQASHANLLALRRLVETGVSIFSGHDGVTEVKTPKPELRCSTSGSMGHAKIICRRPATWQLSFEANADLFGLGPTDHVAIFGSLGHSLALYGALEAAHLGADISTLHGVRPDKQAKLLDQFEVSVLYITPTQLGQLLIASCFLPHVRHVMVGGGKLSGALRIKAQDNLPNANIIAFYGASETSFITVTNATTPAGSVGRAYRDVDIQIDPKTGEIWIKSPYLFECYANAANPDLRDGYISVGEIGYLDDQKNLFLQGRKGRMVTIADQNVHPEAAEAMLKEHLNTDKIAVLPVLDEKRGHVLVAVFCASMTPDTCEAALLQCRNDLGPIQSPRRFHLVSEFPLLEAGKPDLARLQEWLKDQA